MVPIFSLVSRLLGRNIRGIFRFPPSPSLEIFLVSGVFLETCVLVDLISRVYRRGNTLWQIIFWGMAAISFCRDVFFQFFVKALFRVSLFQPSSWDLLLLAESSLSAFFSSNFVFPNGVAFFIVE